MVIENFKLRRVLNDAQAEALKGTFLDDNAYDTLITSDADGYDLNGNLLFRFRKDVIPAEVLRLGVDAFRGSITLTDGRGMAAGGNYLRKRKDGTESKISIADKVESGNVGYMDASAMVQYCRKTAFAREHFEYFQQGVPFVQHVDKLYAELCPQHHARQMAISRGTNQNYRIADTSFTTVTVNRNFQTAVHKDSGDFPNGFGNLCCQRTGHYEGCYFTLPEYRVAIDLQNTDMLFVDVHRWHGNTAFKDAAGKLYTLEELPAAPFERISFVMYYREYMYKCKQPSEELKHLQQTKNGFFNL